MILANDALGLVHEQLTDAMPEGTVLHLWSVGDDIGQVDLSIDDGDLEQIAKTLEVAYDGEDQAPLISALEHRAVALWISISAEKGPVVSDEEQLLLLEAEASALLVNSTQNLQTLVNALDADQAAEYKGWSDNGGDPDGPAWLLWPCDEALVEAANGCQIASQEVSGFELEYPRYLAKRYRETFPPFPLQGRWSGVSKYMFLTDEEDAVAILRSLRSHEDADNDD